MRRIAWIYPVLGGSSQLVVGNHHFKAIEAVWKGNDPTQIGMILQVPRNSGKYRFIGIPEPKKNNVIRYPGGEPASLAGGLALVFENVLRSRKP